MAWAALADTVPIYSLYAVLFADTGLSGPEISALFLIWSLVSIVAEVPSGALADRFSRRSCVVAASVLQAAGYACWLVVPDFVGFAAGFVLWGLGGALVSGAFEALVYDGLAEVGAQEHYARLQGWISAAGLVAQVGAAFVATGLFLAGGYRLVAAVSVGVCVATALLAMRLPEPSRSEDSDDGDDDGAGYFATLRAGIVEAAADPAVRAVVLAVAVVSGLDAFEEYFPLMARDWGVSSGFVPVAMVVISLAGAAGAAMGGAANRLGPGPLAWLLVGSVVALGASGVLRESVGLVLVAVFYGLYRVVLVVTDARLQERMSGMARATVTSVAAVVAVVVYGVWAVGEVVAMAGLFLAVAVLLPGWLRRGEAPASVG